jgi:putative ABC transport system permease protein
MSFWSWVASGFRGDPLNRGNEETSGSPLLYFDSLRADAVFGWRQIHKRKATSAAAILSLALAIGACTAAFRLVDALFLRPMPVSHSERLYALVRYGKGFSDGKPRVETSYEYPVFQQMRGAVKDQAELIAVSYVNRTDLTYRSEDEMEKAAVQYVSGTMFGVFGMQPALGRLLAKSDDLEPGAHPYCVLSYDYWAHRFGKDPGVIGRTLHMGGIVYEIVGVGPKSFTGTEPGTVADIFVPTMMNAGVTHPDWGWIRMLVVLNAGSIAEPVQERLRAVYATMQRARASEFSGRPKQFLDRFFSWQVGLRRASAGISSTQDDYRLPLTILSVLVAMVLLIACANVANLMSAQAAARAREMAVRFSLGARRGRLVRLVMAEGAMVGLAAGVLGVLFAMWATPFVVSRIQRPDQPIRLALEPDGALATFVILLTLGVTLMFGLLPALRSSVVRPAGALKGSTEPLKRRRWMHGLIAAQAAFCFVVLFVAGLFIATFARLTQQPLGFSAAGVLLVDIGAKHPLPPTLWEQAAERLRRMPGVESVAQAKWSLLSGVTENSFIVVNGEVSPELASTLAISPGWIDAMRVRLISGRDLRESDAKTNAAMVNESFARQYFGRQNPIGKTFAEQGRPSTLEVVGVIGNAGYQNLHEAARSVFYLPLHRDDEKGQLVPIDDETFVVRTAFRDPLAMSESVRKTITREHPEFRVTNVRTQQELIDAQTIRERLLALLASFFAGVALLLAGIGLYGVLSYSVLQREREFGIRIAVGASVQSIARLAMTEVFAMVVSGAIAGIALGMASVRYVGPLLFEVKGNDPTMLAAPATVLLGAAMLAALPAVVRAVRVDPAIMLRSE